MNIHENTALLDAFVDGELVVYAVGVSRSTPTGEIEKFDSWFYCEPY